MQAITTHKKNQTDNITDNKVNCYRSNTQLLSVQNQLTTLETVDIIALHKFCCQLSHFSRKVLWSKIIQKSVIFSNIKQLRSENLKKEAKNAFFMTFVIN